MAIEKRFQVGDEVELMSPKMNDLGFTRGVVVAEEGKESKDCVRVKYRHNMGFYFEDKEFDTDPELLELVYRPGQGFTSPEPSVEPIVRALRGIADRIAANPYADIVIKLQAGVPAMIEVTTKHKPAAEGPKKDEPKGPSPREQYRAVLQGQIDTLTESNKYLATCADADSLIQLRENQAEIRRLTVELLNT